MVQILGLSQGLFDVKTDSAGKLTVNRNASLERMVDPSGVAVRDSALELPLSRLREYVWQRARVAEE
jgi:hypothetical protein